ncbi:reverse transcriptase domain-containing protein [Tanacetum coccineum]
MNCKSPRGIPSEDPYEEVARQLLEQAPRSPEYVPDPMKLEDHVLVYIPEPEHPEDLVPAKDEAPYITEVASAPTPPLPPPSFLPSVIRPPRTPPLLPILLPAPSTSYRADIPEADTPPRKRLLLTTPRPRCKLGKSSAATATRQPGPIMAHRVDYSFVDIVETRVQDTERRMMAAIEVVNLRVSHQVDVHRRESSEFYSRHHDAQKDRAAVRAEIEILRRERLAYEQESIETHQALARSEAYSRALEARITVLETQARRLEWQRQDANDYATRHIMCIQALEAGARDDTLEDIASRRMSVEEIKQIVAQRVTNAIDTIAIYEAQTNMAYKSLNQAKHQEDKVSGNTSNKRKWEGDQNRSPNQQQNKEHKMFRSYAVGPNNKKEYLGSLPLCKKCKFHHNGPRTVKCGNCKKVGHMTQDCRNPVAARNQRTLTCYECGELGHYKRDCPLVKFQNHVVKYWKGKARRDSNVMTSNINI